jgi:hypothetical protein
MTYARKIILHAPAWDSPLLEAFVEACRRDRVDLVCVVGRDCERVHDVIDEITVGDGSRNRLPGPTTTWHTSETLAEVRAFARVWSVEGDEYAAVEEVTL